MPKTTVKNLHLGGIAKDVPPSELPVTHWSNGNNVRFRDGGVEKTKGHTTALGTASVEPIYLLPYIKPDTAGTRYYIYAGLNSGTSQSEVYAVNDTSPFTSKAIHGTALDGAISIGSKWTGGVFNGIAILNNTVDPPAYWLGDYATPTAFATLTDWPADTLCRCIRPFRNFLVALDITDTSTTPDTRYPHQVKWSHQAPAGSVPASWTAAATNDAGSYEIGEENDACIDLIPLRESAIIYKERSAWAMTYVGGGAVFSFRKILSQTGMLTANCGTAFGDRHFIVTADDIVVHDGQRPQSVVNGRVRRSVFREIDSDNYGRSFVVPHHAENEIWFCYPVAGDLLPTKALIWNYETGATTFRDLPGYGFIAAGTLPSGATNTWNADTDSWDSDLDSWNSLGFAPSSPRLIAAYPDLTADTPTYGGGKGIHVLDQTLQFNGTNITSYVERTGIPIFGQSVDGAMTNGVPSLKFVRRVYPHMTGAGTVQISVGAQMVKDGPITWDGPYDYDVASDYKLDVRLTGRYMALRVRETSTGQWKLHGYDYDWDPAGER